MGFGTFDTAKQGKLIGFVQVVVSTPTGAKVYALPVQSVRLGQDSDTAAGGLFRDSRGELGIVVDEASPPEVVQEQIKAAMLEASTMLSRKTLN